MTEVERDTKGKFVKGQSGNPVGRPKGKKNEITELKQDLEIALRTHIKPEQVKTIIDSMVIEALKGSVGAAKLILDKVLSNARDAEDVKDHSGGIRIVIENLTAGAMKDVPGITIEHTTEEESNE